MMAAAGGHGEEGFTIDVHAVVQLFMGSYNAIDGAFNEAGELVKEYNIYERTPQGLRWIDTWPGEGTPDNMFRQVEHLNKKEKKDLFWKLKCGRRNREKTNTLMQMLAEMSDMNVTLCHNGSKVVNIFKVRGYMPLDGLDKEFVIDRKFELDRVDVGGASTSSRLYPVLSEYQAICNPDFDLMMCRDNCNSSSCVFLGKENECDKVVRETQTKSVAKKRKVGTDDICIHFWTVLTLENGTMLHIDTTGPIYECYEYEEVTGIPLVLRETPELLLEEPKGSLKKVFPDSVVMTNKCLDGTIAELPDWRPFKSFDIYPAEVMFMDQFRGRGGSILEQEVPKSPLTHVRNMTILTILGIIVKMSQEDLLVELYHLKNNKFNGKQGMITRGINFTSPRYTTEDSDGYPVTRIPVILLTGKTISVRTENMKLLPKSKRQYLLWRQVERKMGWKHKLCKCVDWKKGLGTRIGLRYPIDDCDSDCSDHEDREDETNCTFCHRGCHGGRHSFTDGFSMPEFNPESSDLASFLKEWESVLNPKS